MFIIEKIKSAYSGDENAMMDLITQFSPLIKKYARKLYAEDAENELLLAFIELISFFDIGRIKNTSDGAVINYICQSIRRAYIKLMKKEIDSKVESTSIELLTDKDMFGSTLSTIDQSFALDIPKGTLTQREYTILMWIYVDGYSAAEIAKQLRTTRQNINQTKKRAERKLRLHIMCD